MSKGQNRRLCRWEKISEFLRAVHFKRCCKPLTDRDCETWRDALLLEGCLLEDLNFDTVFDVGEYIRVLSSLDVVVVSSALKKADDWVISQLTTLSRPLSEFKQQAACDGYLVVVEPFLGFLEYHEQYTDYEVLTALHQAFAFLGRVSLKDIEIETLPGFVERDEAIPDPDPAVCKDLRVILADWLSDFVVDSFPKHGPGATSDGGGGTRECPKSGNHSNFAKYVRVAPDKLVRYVWHKYGPCDIERILPPIPPGWATAHCNRISRYQDVPKTALKRRVICMEPSGMQYFQQAVKASLYDYICHHSYLGKRIALRDQTVNQFAARDASISGAYATLDLSAASDSVGWSLVKSIFARTPLLPWLFATRSTDCETPYGVIHLRKFATMGSALTFPVESLVFGAVCELCSRVSGVPANRSDWQVYGDDIIVRDSYRTDVVDVLTTLGFTVNQDKSFFDDGPGQFRESCGGEYYNGVNVTPVRVPRKFVGGRIDVHHPELLDDLVEFANECELKGYRSTRRWILRRIMELPTWLQPAWGEVSPRLLTLGGCDPAYQRIRRHSRSLQRREVKAAVKGRGATGKATVVGSHTIAGDWVAECYPELATFHWQLCSCQHEVDDLYSKPMEPVLGPQPAQQLKSCWCPVDVFESARLASEADEDDAEDKVRIKPSFLK